MAVKQYWIDNKKVFFQQENDNCELISWNPNTKILRAKINNTIYETKVLSSPTPSSNSYNLYLYHSKKNICIQTRPPRDKVVSSSSKLLFKPALYSPIGGKIVAIHAKPNQPIDKNQPLVTIESMKMENIIHATSDAFIKTVSIRNGDLVQPKQILMLFELRSSKNATPNNAHVKKEIPHR
jgi:biotin carboxyl carrier protein